MATATLPAPFNLNLYRGDDFIIAFVYGIREADTQETQILSTEGWSAHAQIRKDWGRDVWLDLTVDNGLRLEYVNGDIVVYMHITSDQTEGTEWNRRDWGVWDLELTDPDGIKTTIFAGEVFITSDVTRGVQ